MASEAPLLTPLAEDIWIVDGPTIDFYRIPFPTRPGAPSLEEALTDDEFGPEDEGFGA